MKPQRGANDLHQLPRRGETDLGSAGYPYSAVGDPMTLDEALRRWRPISLAPAGKFVLVYCPEDGSRWLAKRRGNIWYGVDDEGLTREGAGLGHPNIVTGWFVSHWMPLPEAPANE